MGEKQNGPFQLSFNASLKIDFQGSRVTSDGGLIRVRELDERVGFGELIEQHLTDSRRGKDTQFLFADPLRQSVYSRLSGYEDLNDAERLSQDPTAHGSTGTTLGRIDRLFNFLDRQKDTVRWELVTSRTCMDLPFFVQEFLKVLRMAEKKVSA